MAFEPEGNAMKTYWSRRGLTADGSSHREIAEAMGKTEDDLYNGGWVRCVYNGHELFLTHNDAGLASAYEEVFANRFNCTQFLVESLKGFRKGNKFDILNYLDDHR
jgi:hypothetical protein